MASQPENSNFEQALIFSVHSSEVHEVPILPHMTFSFLIQNQLVQSPKILTYMCTHMLEFFPPKFILHLVYPVHIPKIFLKSYVFELSMYLLWFWPFNSSTKSIVIWQSYRLWFEQSQLQILAPKYHFFIFLREE